jgi:dTDP-glucose 4,6-dehydratase
MLPPIERYDQIVSGTRNVLDFSVSTGAKRFLLTSTGGVYGQQPQGMDKIPETYCGFPDPLRPENVHSIAKRAAEHLCILYGHQFGIEPVIARCFAFVGMDLPLDVHFAIGNFIRDATQGRDIIIQGDGTSVRSYLDQHDLSVWLTRLLNTGHPQTAYNIGSENAISIKDLAILVRDLVHPTGSVQILGVVNNAATRYVPDTQLARETLGLSETVSLSDAIRRALPPC